MIDLDELEQLLAVCDGPYDNTGHLLERETSFQIILREAAPALIAAARERDALKAENERLRDAL